MIVTELKANELASQLNLDLEKISLKEWVDGINVELEHGSNLGPITNVTNDDLETTAKIAFAHLVEDPKYYSKLEMIEKNNVFFINKKIIIIVIITIICIVLFLLYLYKYNNIFTRTYHL